MGQVGRFVALGIAVLATTLMVAEPARANRHMYCDYYYYCNAWDGDHCYDEWYDYTCDWYDDGTPDEGGGGSGTQDPVVVNVTEASITENQVAVQLSPWFLSGRLLVEAVRSDDSRAVLSDDTRAGGNYTFSFRNDSLAEGAYTYVRATWSAFGPNAAVHPNGTRPVIFQVLGSDRHSQYNVPYEGTCTAGRVAREVFTSPCSGLYQTFLKYDFANQVDLNGTGVSETVGILHTAAGTSCSGQGAHYYNIPSVTGKDGRAVDDTTVAKRTQHPHLNLDDQVFLAGAPGIRLKTVTDACPGCAERQLDNFNTVAACSGNAVGDYGNFLTIRLR